MTADNIIVHAVDIATGQLSRAEDIPPLLIPMPECLQFVEAPIGVPQPGADLLAVETKVLPAMVTPLMPDGSLDVESVDRVVDDCLGPQRCSGLYINGMTGEGLFLPMALRKEMAERCIQQAAGRGHCIVHVAAASTADINELQWDAASDVLSVTRRILVRLEVCSRCRPRLDSRLRREIHVRHHISGEVRAELRQSALLLVPSATEVAER